MATREDFCSFEALEGHCAPLSALSGVSTGDLAEAIASASDLIWALTGRQFGAYTETVRPDLRSVSSSSFDLRRFPVSGIVEVKVDGVVLDPTEYWVSDGHVLNRTDGTSWPATQKLYLDDTEEETFSVTLTWGGEPPIGVQQATRRLACELLSLKFGGQSGLPDRVRSTVRQGISMEHVSAEDLLNNGRTGIFEIDLVLSTYNRDETAALPAVMSPDIGWYDHDGTTTVGVAPGGGGTGGVSAAYVMTAISEAVSGVGILVLAAGDPVPDGYTGLYVRLTTGAGGGGGGVSLGETSTTAYRGDRGKTAYDHSQVTTGNPHGTTAADVGADPAGTAAGLVDDLSGVSNQATARTNLGLGGAAVLAVGTTAGTVAAGDDSRFGGVSESYVADAISAAVSGLGNDVVEVANFAALPGTGETGLIYVTLDTNLTYRWSGSAYVEISASLALGETSSTAYRGDRGKTAYDHSQVTTGNPHGTTAADVGADPAGTAAGLVDDLSGVSNQATARTNLGLGTAATAATGDFAAASHTHTGSQVTVDASGFNGNLTTSDDTVQEIAQKLDDLVIPAAGIADPGGSNDDFLQRKSGAWTNRTVAEVKTDLGVTDVNRAHRVAPASKMASANPYSLIGPYGNGSGTLVVATGMQCLMRVPGGSGQTIERLAVHLSASALTSGQTIEVSVYDEYSGSGPGTRLWTQNITIGASTGTLYASGLAHVIPTQPFWVSVLNPSGNAGAATFRTSQVTGATVLALFWNGTPSAILRRTAQASAASDLSALTYRESSDVPGARLEVDATGVFPLIGVMT